MGGKVKIELKIVYSGCEGEEMKKCVNKLRQYDIDVEYTEEFIGRWQCHDYKCYINLNTLDELFLIPTVTGYEIIINEDKSITIYNDYIE